ncbi:hypothetical protein IZ6_27510 [Terrihabitans soli]|uniref:Uncharacterized protein n=1 Tax=Terrihabitans soli TaxID=708113 RepID=A0A6S6QR07_9HYPH|nr:hypothetical protein [Terrihabitans soli]BCJ92016.1 hypothetical protein IZ6_27510 [Terrihabitans soli]
MRSVPLVLACLCLLPASTLAEEVAWSDVFQSEGIYSINFGVPNSDDVRFFMSCTKERTTVELSWHADIDKPNGMKTGADGMRARLENQSVEIRFAGGDNVVKENVKAAFQPEEMSGGIFVDFFVPKTAAILQKFRSNSDAALIISGAKPQELDLKGADVAIDKLLKACGG